MDNMFLMNCNKKERKAVTYAAGLGTRFVTMTKVHQSKGIVMHN